MDTNQLKYFISAVNIGNFTLAALENNISQSSFSKQIMSLENELNIKLFERYNRTVKLTPAGEKFQIYALRMLNGYEDMMRGMESYREFQTLPVGIASIPVIRSYELTELFSELKQSSPDILISIEERAESSEVRHLLHSGACDLAVMRMEFLDDNKYNIYPIITDRLAAIVSAEHPLADREVVSIKELENDRFVMPPDKSDLRTFTQNACIANGFRPQPSYIFSGSVAVVLELIEKENLTYLAFEGVLRHYMKDHPLCRLLRLSETVESRIAFVSLRDRCMTDAQKKVERYLDRISKNAAASHM